MKLFKLALGLVVCFFFYSPFLDLVQAEKRLQTAFSQRICLTITQAPHQNQTISWRTNTSTDTAKAQHVALADFIGQKNGQKVGQKTILATSKTIKKSENDHIFHHSVTLKNLLPDTWYTYRVGDEEHWSEWNRFRTASAKPGAFEFVYFGDIQNKIEPLCTQVFRAVCQTIPKARFWLFAGDMVNDGFDDGQWHSFFNALGWMPKNYPLVPVAGNHEYPHPKRVAPEHRKVTPLWQPHFNLPQNGPKGLKQTCYSFQYQGVLFMILNGNEKLEEQARWMEDLLTKNTHPWVIAAIHQPAYATSTRRDVTTYQDLFVPVYDRFGVDLVLQGHDHAYSRSFPLKNHKKVNSKGTIYLMSVAGPKSYPVSPRYKHLFAVTDTGKQLFQSVRVNQTKMEIDVFDLAGNIVDTFEIIK